MKKVKIAFWIILIVLLGITVYQNQGYFLTKHSLDINLWFTRRIVPPVQNGIVILAFFLFGLLVGLIHNFFERYRTNKTIKDLRNTIRSNEAAIGQMRQEIEALKPSTGELPPASPDVETPAASKDTPT